MGWWPFGKRQQLTPEQADRCRRRCGMAAATLVHCLAANTGDPGVCSSLETQVVHCHAEVVCPELAAAHQRCFQRVVNSKGREPYSTCTREVEAMKKCLRKVGLFPFGGAGAPGAPRSGSGSARCPG